MNQIDLNNNLLNASKKGQIKKGQIIITVWS